MRQREREQGVCPPPPVFFFVFFFSFFFFFFFFRPELFSLFLFLSLPRHFRYTMKEAEIVNAAEWALDHGMGTLMLQSGELLTEKRLHFVESAVRQVRALRKARDGGENDSSSSLAVALSIGELNAASYRRMVDAGASRYLLRIGEVPLFVFLFPFLVPSLFVSHRVLLSLCLSSRPPLSFSLTASSSLSLSPVSPPPPLSPLVT